MKKFLLLLCLFTTPAYAQHTIDALSAGTTIVGTEKIPMFQTANPAVTTTPSAINTYIISKTNTWTAGQTFTNSDLILKGSSTGVTTFTSSNAGASNFTVTVPGNSLTIAALDVADQTVSGGANVTSDNLGTITMGTTTIDCGVRPLQYFTNGGASTLAAPAADGSCIVLMTNNGSAGAITFSGFSVGSNTGDAVTTTNTQKFSIFIWRINSTSGYRIAAHQ